MKKVTCLGCLRSFASGYHLERHLAAGTYPLWKRALNRRYWTKKLGYSLRKRGAPVVAA